MPSSSSPLLFPLFFIAIWISVTFILSGMSGWFSLRKRYPDQAEVPTEKISIRHCTVGSVRCNGIISFEICPSGLRVKMLRIFGPFCKPLFFPWSELTIERRNGIFENRAIIHFGFPTAGKITVGAHVADHFARKVGSRWPENGSFVAETPATSFRAIFKTAALNTLVATAFFIVIPRLMAPPQARPPYVIAILFPLVVFTLLGIYEYFSRRKHAK